MTETESIVILVLATIAAASITVNAIQFDLNRDANQRAEDAAAQASRLARQRRRRELYRGGRS